VRGSFRFWITGVLCLVSAACSTGEGEGWVRSDRLYIEDCWNGPFNLRPTFFGANPYREESLLIRVQRGDNLQEVSDGLTVVVSDLAGIRDDSLGQPIPVGLPPGVAPYGTPVSSAAASIQVSLGLYLHDTCHAENGTVYSLSGTITFDSLFSGDPNESEAAERLTDANFEATFADPRELTADGSVDAATTSLVSGHFRFFFQRGQPAQPFP
jgi:hypothetical protein